MLVSNKDKYTDAVKVITPFLEKFHKIKFDESNKSEKFTIIPALTLDHVLTLENYQLIKFDDWHLNPEAEMIDIHWQEDNRKFKEKKRVL